MTKIKITFGNKKFIGELDDSPTAKLVFDALPLHGNANVWGEEIYFPVPFTAEPEMDAVEEVEVGTLAYWPPGKAFCIFFGPTPVSTSAKPRAYSPVNIFGKIHGNLGDLREVSPDEKIMVDCLI